MKIPSLRWPFAAIFKRPWWVKIKTQMPTCIYYFGPFESEKEAVLSQAGYIDDLMQEKSQGISVEIKRVRPRQLTVCEN